MLEEEGEKPTMKDRTALLKRQTVETNRIGKYNKTPQGK